jgi:hypothetical protein
MVRFGSQTRHVHCVPVLCSEGCLPGPVQCKTYYCTLYPLTSPASQLRDPGCEPGICDVWLVPSPLHCEQCTVFN